MCVYFKESGSHNTDEVLRLAKEKAKELSIKNILAATTSGKTGAKASELFQGYNLVVVTHSAGFSSPNTQELLPENKDLIVHYGGKLLTCQHAFGGVGRAVRRSFNTYQMEEIIASTLRTFGQGTKVAIEISLMAADAGLIRTDEEAISIGGSDHGADTALILLPANAQDFFKLQVLEIICKPRKI